MSSSSKKLQDEVPKELFFVVAEVGATHASPGEAIYRSYLKAYEISVSRNTDRHFQIIRRKKVQPLSEVFVVFPRRKKDAHKTFGGWKLLRRTPVQKMTQDEITARRIQEKMFQIGRTNDE